MYQKKVFQSFGGLKMLSEDIEDINAQDYTFWKIVKRFGSGTKVTGLMNGVSV